MTHGATSFHAAYRIARHWPSARAEAPGLEGIKRLDYMMQDNSLVGERDPDITRKTNKLKEELKQIQIQLIDVPIEMTANMTEEELNQYINSPRVNKKYRLRKK
jgi:hypothetical protein